MNTEVESYIRNNYAWLKLPQNVRQVPLVHTWAKGLSCLPRFLISGPTKSRPEPVGHGSESSCGCLCKNGSIEVPFFYVGSEWVMLNYAGEAGKWYRDFSCPRLFVPKNE